MGEYRTEIVVQRLEDCKQRSENKTLTHRYNREMRYVEEFLILLLNQNKSMEKTSDSFVKQRLLRRYLETDESIRGHRYEEVEHDHQNTIFPESHLLDEK